MLKFLPAPIVILLSMALGLFIGFLKIPFCFQIANALADIFMNVFKAISLPVIFFSLVSAISGLAGLAQVQRMGGRVFLLSLFTTFISSVVALAVYLLVKPALASVAPSELNTAPVSFDSYFASLRKIFPSNFLSPFIEGNSLAVVVIAIGLGLAALTLPSAQRKIVHVFFASFQALLMKVVSGITFVLPVGVWAFSVLFAKDLESSKSLKSVGLYLCAIVAANLIQAFFVLPILLRRAKLSVRESVKGMWPALSLAFFTKSSVAAMPLAMRCAENHLHVEKNISRFAFPLCTSVNMNACAGFILITFLFVGETHGMVFAPWDLLQWTVMATIVAMGHAGVPMGCFFLASALVAQANLPMTLMGIILPFYTLLDMLESAINLWSDSCITLVLNRKESLSLS